ncbi:uncharacterized protein LOC125177635 [Hyalella azteca]|uniref:Uncharacterized protein LOC125177635 n=1 Tax=Hyalella azteca TaxID=294128 RepID=A0A979FFN8_HYAAZ|nr:uncharacterized protein LOC125177635 [Hyalella azteca]
MFNLLNSSNNAFVSAAQIEISVHISASVNSESQNTNTTEPDSNIQVTLSQHGCGAIMDSTENCKHEVSKSKYNDVENHYEMVHSILIKLQSIHGIVRSKESSNALAEILAALSKAFADPSDVNCREVKKGISDHGMKWILSSTEEIIRAISPISSCWLYDRSDRMRLRTLKSRLKALVIAHINGNSSPVVIESFVKLLKDISKASKVMKRNIKTTTVILKGKRYHDLWSRLFTAKSVRDLIPDSGKVESCALCFLTEITSKINFAFFSSCQHIFCRPCILEWMNINQSCPVCQQPMMDLSTRDEFVSFKRRQFKMEDKIRRRALRAARKSSRCTKKEMKD